MFRECVSRSWDFVQSGDQEEKTQQVLCDPDEIDIYSREASPLVLPSRCKSGWHLPAKSYCAFLALCVVRTLLFAGWQLEKAEQNERQSSRQWRRQSLWLFAAVEAGSCRADLFVSSFPYSCCFNLPRILSGAVWGLGGAREDSSVSPSHPLFLQAFLPVYALRCAYPRDRAQDNHWLRNSSSHTHEMSYEMFQGHCHSRCRISWRRSRAADLRILRSKNSFEQKAALTFTVFLRIEAKFITKHLYWNYKTFWWRHSWCYLWRRWLWRVRDGNR